MWQMHTQVFTCQSKQSSIKLYPGAVLLPLDRQSSVSVTSHFQTVHLLSLTFLPHYMFPSFPFSVKEVDNTLTVIIVSALGGVIGLVIIVMVIKAVVVHFLGKDEEKKWVNSLLWSWALTSMGQVLFKGPVVAGDAMTSGYCTSLLSHLSVKTSWSLLIAHQVSDSKKIKLLRRGIFYCIACWLL